MTANTSLVQTHGQQVFTTSLIVAKGCDNKSHESTIKLIRKHHVMFESLGQLDFKSDSYTSHTGGKLTEYAVLNEDQATFLVTLFRNTKTVLAFKLKLVQEFRKALDALAQPTAALPATTDVLSLSEPMTSEAAWECLRIAGRAEFRAVEKMHYQFSPNTPRNAFSEEMCLHAFTKNKLINSMIKADRLERELAELKRNLRALSLTSH